MLEELDVMAAELNESNAGPCAVHLEYLLRQNPVLIDKRPDFRMIAYWIGMAKYKGESMAAHLRNYIVVARTLMTMELK